MHNKKINTMATKLPYGLKLRIIRETGASYHEVNRALQGKSIDHDLMATIRKIIADHKQAIEELGTALDNL